jgi:hypothetical protein
MQLLETDLIDQLAQSPSTISALCSEMGIHQWRWSPDDQSWSPHEIICHMYDEERDDFRQRLRLTLEDPNTEWPPNDPEGWVVAHNYADQDSKTVLADLIGERYDSVTWLRSLTDPSWSNVHERDSGAVSAGDLLASWVAHDLHHLRQLIKVSLAYLEHHTPHSAAYAI